ncbi:MAG: RNA-directed DNA polymerase [Patescibacteria group bacterium]
MKVSRSNRERERETAFGRGIPIGNLTSQLFANIYLNEFDYFIKHSLKVKYYVRYTDDFVIVSDNERCLLNLIPKIKAFLTTKLKLEIHPNKILIRKFRQGIDFLGFVVFPKHRLLRTKTKRRIFQKLKLGVKEYKTGLISEETIKQSLNSYLGVLSHANTYELHQELENQYWFWLRE